MITLTPPSAISTHILFKVAHLLKRYILNKIQKNSFIDSYPQTPKLKKIQSLILGLLIVTLGFCQNRDTIRLPENRPVKCGYTFAPNENGNGDPIDGIMIYSYSPTCDSVFSLTKGKVKAVRKIEDYFVCIIETEETLYIYALLHNTELQPGISINKEDYIGQMKFDTSDTGDNELLLQIRRKNKSLNFNEQLVDLMAK